MARVYAMARTGRYTLADTTSGLDQKERRESDYSKIENRGEEIKDPLGYGGVVFPW